MRFGDGHFEVCCSAYLSALNDVLSGQALVVGP